MVASEDPSASASTPYAGLTPSLVLDALDGVGLRGDGRLIQLNSYENRVFQIFLEDGRVVVAKFYRPGRWSDVQILEEHGFTAELAAAEIPVAAPWTLAVSAASMHGDNVGLLGPTLARFDTSAGSHRFAVCTRMAGRAPDLEELPTLEWIGRFVGRIHAVGAAGRYEHRETLDVATFGDANRDRLLDANIIPPDALSGWRDVTARALERVRDAFDRHGRLRMLRVHGDCHIGNLLWTAAGPHFVDLDDTLTAPAAQDLWMLLSGDRSAMTGQLAAMLDGYETFMDFDWRELGLIEPLRTLRIIHHSAWIARRWEDPAFPIAFPWFESPAYWAEQTTRLREQLVAMAEPPLGGPA